MKKSIAYALRKTVNRISLKRSALPRIAGVGAVLLALLVISSCTRGTQGIFATIEVEEKTKNNNLVDDTSASALVRANLGSGERFVVRAGSKLFTRSVSGSDWSALSAPSGYLPVFLAGINTDTSADGVVEEVYAVFFDSERDRDYLYELDESAAGTVSWNPLDVPSIWDPSGGERITGFEGADNRLLFSSSDGQLYSVAAGATSVATLGEFVAGSRGIRAVATNDAGETVVLGEKVYVTDDLGTDGTLSASADQVADSRGVTVFPSSLTSGGTLDTFLLVTFEVDGKVFTSADGDSWTEADSGSNIPGDRSFAGVAWVDHRELLTVGTLSNAQETDANGYYEVTTGSDEPPYTLSFTNDEISDNYRGSELSTSGIARFVYYADSDPEKGTLFALTHGRGLWRTNYESDVRGPDWLQE